MTLRRALGTEHGFSLTELVVVVGIGITLMISLSSALITQQRDEVALKQNIETNEVENEMRLIMSNSQSCLTTLQSLGSLPTTEGNPVPLENIYSTIDGVTNVMMSKDQVFNNAVQISRMTLETVYKPPTNYGKWQLAITIYFNPLSGNALLRPRTVPVFVNVDQTSAMTGCSVRVMEAPEYNCIPVRQPGSGRSTTVTCPADYRMVSCGMNDGASDKNDWRRTRPQPDSKSCYCYDHNSSSLSCYAICCKG